MKPLVTAALVCAALSPAQHPSSRLLANRNGESAAYTGIGRLHAGGICTAFLLDTGAESGPAYVLSNGHCVGMLEPNEVIVDRPQTGYSIVFNYFHDTQDRQDRVASRRIAYATMKGVDLSVIELDTTLGELRTRGYRPLPLTREPPREGDTVVMAGAPAQDMPAGEMFLRVSRCSLGPAVDVLELRWFWRGSYRNDCPDAKPGSSGSPVISETGLVVGIMNTTTIDSHDRGGDFNCYLNTPCEVTTDGEQVLEDTSYATPVTGLNACFDSGGRFAHTAAGCPLDSGRQPGFKRSGGRTVAPGARWNVAVHPGPFAYYRYKTFREGAGDCRNAEGYADPIAIGPGARIDDVIGDRDGRYFLCVLGGPGPRPDSSWQQLAFASVFHARVDSAPPILPARYSVREEAGRYVVSFIFVPPELSGYRSKSGPPETTGCKDRAGYKEYARAPVTVMKTDGPGKLCIAAHDEAGNEGPPIELLLGR